METAKLLIENCASLNLRNKEHGRTPIHIAKKQGNSCLGLDAIIK